MSGSADGAQYVDLRIDEFLELVASTSPAPAAGSATALVLGLGASLCLKTARLSRRLLPVAEEMAEEAASLQRRALELCQEDSVAVAALLAAGNLAGFEEGDAGAHAEAVIRAATVPAELAELGAAVTNLAARLAAQGNPNLLGDAVAAAIIAEAATRAAAGLVTIDLGSLADPALSGRAELAAGRAALDAARARDARRL